jgi:hypothetical protein
MARHDLGGDLNGDLDGVLAGVAERSRTLVSVARSAVAFTGSVAGKPPAQPGTRVLPPRSAGEPMPES